MNVEIDIEDYLDRDTLVQIAKDVAYSKFKLESEYCNVKTLLSNAAYEIVKKYCADTLGVDAMKQIEENTQKLATDESSLKFCLFYDGAQYGGLSKEKGIALKTAEDYFKKSCVKRIQNTVDGILDKMKFDTKKFEQMVVKEAARMVAEKMTANQK